MQAKGYKGPKKKSDKEDLQHFEARRPLELAQMDILELFINKLKVYIISLMDDFSGFIPGWRLLTETFTDAVILLVQTAIDRYGKMQEILTDRGFVFYSWRGIKHNIDRSPYLCGRSQKKQGHYRPCLYSLKYC